MDSKTADAPKPQVEADRSLSTPASAEAPEQPESAPAKPAAKTTKTAKAAKAPKTRKTAKTVKSCAKSGRTTKTKAKSRAKELRLADELPPPLPAVTGVPDLNDPILFINRELNWIEFNRKVLDEACEPNAPLLERLKFLAIFYNNLDEFFMVRVANIFRQFNAGAPSASADGLAPAKQLSEIRRRVLVMLARAQTLWKDVLQPQLFEKGVRLLRYKDLTAKQKAFLEGYFENEIYPILTPQAIDAGHPFPTISNVSANFLVELASETDGETRYARLKVPNNMPRFIFVPRTKQSAYAELGINSNGRDDDIILLEDLVREHLDKLFPGHAVKSSALFRITRNTDIEIEEDEADDLLAAVKDFVEQRRFGDVIRLEIESTADAPLLNFLVDKLGLLPFQVYRTKGPMAMSEFMPLCGLDRPALKASGYKGAEPAWVENGNVFETIKNRDVLLYHPYESFSGVTAFVRQAAEDPQVVAIKQTLYRCGSNSPIVAALIEARKRGKQVTAVVELKARFDEERNINWAEEMEKAGVNIVYGFVGLKIHAKLCLVVRREAEGLTRYLHVSTGNYNPGTAKIYTDYSLFTANRAICSDASDLFNAMTGYSLRTDYNELVVSPPFDARFAHCAHRARDRQQEGRQARADHLQVQSARRPPHHREALRSEPGWRAREPHRARHLLPAPGHSGDLGEHRGAQHRRPIPRARARLLVHERGLAQASDRLGRPHAAKPRRPHRGARADSGSRHRRAHQGDPRPAARRQHAVLGTPKRRQLRAAPPSRPRQGREQPGPPRRALRRRLSERPSEAGLFASLSSCAQNANYPVSWRPHLRLPRAAAMPSISFPIRRFAPLEFSSILPAAARAALERRRSERTFPNLWFGAPDVLALSLKETAAELMAAHLPAGFSGRLGFAAAIRADGALLLAPAAMPEAIVPAQAGRQLPQADQLAGVSPDEVFEKIAAATVFADAAGAPFTLLSLAQALRAGRPERIARGGGAGLNLTFAHWNLALLEAAQTPAAQALGALNACRAKGEALELLAVLEWWSGAASASDVKFEGMTLCPRTTAKSLIERLLPLSRMAPDPRLTDPYWKTLRPTIFDETDDFVVVMKPSGLLSVPGTMGLPDAMTLAAAMTGSTLTPVHRLDMDTSGLLVYSKRLEATKSLMAQFREGTVRKHYLARVFAPFDPAARWLDKSRSRARAGLPYGVFTENGREGLIEFPITTNPKDRLRQAAAIGGRESSTRWEILAGDGERTLLKLTPVTGRTHQLRLHAAHPLGLGAPILGDPYYSAAGLSAEAPGSALMLHAAELAFSDPSTGARRAYEAKAPFL